MVTQCKLCGCDFFVGSYGELVTVCPLCCAPDDDWDEDEEEKQEA